MQTNVATNYTALGTLAREYAQKARAERGVHRTGVIEAPDAFADSIGISVWGDEHYGQRAMLRAVRDHQLVVVYAGAGVSKTFNDALLAAWWLQWPHSRVIVTSGTFAQLTAQFVDELQNLYADRLQGHPLYENEPGETKWRLPRDRRLDLRSTNRRGHFTGFHAERVLLIGDEGHALPDWFPNFGRTAILTNPNHRCVITGNPIEDVGGYYGIQNDSRWHAVWISQFSYTQHCRRGEPSFVPVRDTQTGEWDLGPIVGAPPGPVPGMDLDPDEPLRRVEEMGEQDPDV